MSNLKKAIKWSFLEKAFMQIASFVIQIILARLLVPEDFGVVVLMGVFISIASTVVKNGLTFSLIQKIDSDSLDENTIFYTQLLLAFLMYFLLYVGATRISIFYNHIEMTKMIRISSMSLVIGSLSSINRTLTIKNMNFRKSFVATTLGTVCDYIVTVFLAFYGYGTWALIIGSLTKESIMTILYIYLEKWKPKLEFSFSRLKVMFSFSYKLSVGWMIGTVYNQIINLFVGKVTSATQLAYYSRGEQIQSLLCTTFRESVSSVMFSELSSKQKDIIKVKETTRIMLMLGSFIIFPAVFGFAAVSGSFVRLFLTDKWIDSIYYIQTMGFSLAVNSICTLNMQAFNAIGRSDLFMKFEIIKRSIAIVLVLIAIQISLKLVPIALILISFLSLSMNIYQNKKQFNLEIREQLNGILPYIFISLIMFLAINNLNSLKVKLFITFIIQIFGGILLYFILSFVFKVEAYKFILEFFKNKI